MRSNELLSRRKLTSSYTNLSLFKFLRAGKESQKARSFPAYLSVLRRSLKRRSPKYNTVFQSPGLDWSDGHEAVKP